MGRTIGSAFISIRYYRILGRGNHYEQSEVGNKY